MVLVSKSRDSKSTADLEPSSMVFADSQRRITILLAEFRGLRLPTLR
jgi:hypothetical protein